MPMQMTFRWYGEGNDRIKLSDIKQIPGVTGIVWALHHKMPGEIWEIDEIAEVKRQLDEYGFNMDVVESVNVHDDIKIGLPTRDGYIENYKTTIRNLAQFGVKVICYNFMPIFDWTRSNLFHPVGDGSTALFYEKNMIQDDYNAMAKYILDFTEKYNMSFPGWEPLTTKSFGQTSSTSLRLLCPPAASATSRWLSIWTIRLGISSVCPVFSSTRKTLTDSFVWLTIPTTV